MEVVRASLMPQPARFFPADRLWSREGHLPSADCAALLQEAASSPRKPQSLISAEMPRHYDADVRKTQQAMVSRASLAGITRSLMSLRAELSAWCGIRLMGLQPPQFLVYRPGDFFLVHSDRPAGERPIRQRRVLTAVMFLNAPHDVRQPYAGGELMLYAQTDASGRPQGYPLAIQAGQLVVFPAELLHEVLPVQSGVRYTVISWFY